MDKALMAAVMDAMSLLDRIACNPNDPNRQELALRGWNVLQDALNVPRPAAAEPIEGRKGGRSKWWDRCEPNVDLQEANDEIAYMREDWQKLGQALGFEDFVDPEVMIERACAYGLARRRWEAVELAFDSATMSDSEIALEMLGWAMDEAQRPFSWHADRAASG